ncbi:MAG TPA: hypothetical protein VMM93_13135 [Vicinamibacterales bacterium]|nr:hypothetical protein [Vicinamibacterales bacterium]
MALAVHAPRLILLIFLVLQAYDGLFTYTAVRALGISAEGNALLATWMMLVGPGSALVGAKLLAAASGMFVYVRGLHRVLAALTGIYLAAAVGPWTYIFATWP